MNEVTKEKFERLAKDLVSAFQRRLTFKHGYFTGALSRSIASGVVITDTGVTFNMEEYVKYIEYGTPPYGTPHKTTPEELLPWIKEKIMSKEMKKKHPKTAQQIAETMAKHITKYGPRQYPFIRMVIEKDLPGILERNGLTSTVDPNNF